MQLTGNAAPIDPAVTGVERHRGVRSPFGWRPRAFPGARTVGRLSLVGALALGMVTMAAPAASGSSVTSAVFTGGAGSVAVGGNLYAKQGAVLTLTVVTSNDTKCIGGLPTDFVGARTSTTAKTSWIFTTTAPSGNGAQAFTVAASPNFNANNCTGQTNSVQSSYTVDNTGPVVTAAVSPAANAQGWNNNNVDLAWSASDGGSGMGSAPSPATDSQNPATTVTGVTKTATATDKLGNVGTGAVLIKLDKTSPTITVTRAPAANAAGWNNTDVTVALTCSDALSGIKSCTGGGSVTVSAQGANQSVSGVAVDNADNSVTGGLSGISIDKTAPTLTGAPTTPANGNGWYSGNVSIGWSAADALSGLAGAVPSNSTITGEGSGLKAAATVSDKAGNTTNANSAPVNIDRTAPITSISGTSNSWSNGDVTVALSSGRQPVRRRLDGVLGRRRAPSRPAPASPSPPRATTPSRSSARTRPATPRPRRPLT